MSNFDTKSQKILGSQAPVGGLWSIPFEYDPEDVNLLGTRGKLYLVASFKADENIDLQLASKILIDGIKEHYYGDLDGTPLQALENALNYGKEKLQQVAQSSNANTLNLNVVCCVVWGSILYIAQSGETASLIIRNGVVSDISHKTSGEVMTTSGILENEDVVLLTTNKFEQEFNGPDLISKLSNIESLVTSSPNSPLLSAVVIRFKKSMVSGAKDIAGFMSGFKRKKKQDVKPSLDSEVSAQQTQKLNEDSQVVTSINSPSTVKPLEVRDTTDKVEKKEFELKSSSKKGRKPKKLFYTAGALVLLSLVSFGVFKFYSGFVNNSDETNISVVVGETFQSKFDLLSNNSGSLQEFEDLRNEVKQEVESGNVALYDLLSQIDKKIESLRELGNESSNSFYDFRAKSDSSQLNNINFFGDDLLVSDFGAKQAYILTEGDDITIKDVAGSNDYLLTTTDGKNIYVIEKSKVFVGSTPENLQEFSIDKPLTSAQDAEVYFGNIYILSDEKVIKLEESGGSYVSSEWGDVEKGEALAIDGSIYISGENGISKYYTGEKEDFTLAESDNGFENSVAYLGSSSSIYFVSDNKLYSFNKETGAFIESVELAEQVSGVRSFILNSDNVYLVKGSAVYKTTVKSENEDGA